MPTWQQLGMRRVTWTHVCVGRFCLSWRWRDLFCGFSRLREAGIHDLSFGPFTIEWDYDQ